MRTGLDDATIPSEVVRYPLWLRSTATPISFIILTAAMPALRHDVEVNRLDSPVKAAEKNGNSRVYPTAICRSQLLCLS